MDYDFSSLCADQLEKLGKRLKSLNKACLKEYEVALNVINHPAEHEHRGETMVSAEDLLNDVANKCQIFYTENMNKIQRELAKHL
jgi:hypothetical protein